MVMSSTAWVHFAKRVVRRFVPSPTTAVPAEVPSNEESSGTLDRRDREKILQRLLTGRDVRHVFDVGANVGSLTEQYLKSFPNAAIHAFEPNPDLVGRLKTKFAGDTRVTVIDRVVCDHSGSIPFHINLMDATSSILPRDQGRRYFPSEDRLLRKSELPSVTLDDYCSLNSIHHIDLLKFDIQGGEGAALRGSSRLLEKQAVDVLYSECYFIPHYQGALLLHELCGALAPHGYTLYDLFLDLHGRNGQLRFGDALFVSSRFRADVIDRFPDEP